MSVVDTNNCQIGLKVHSIARNSSLVKETYPHSEFMG